MAEASLRKIGHLVAKPIRLAFQIAFGKSDTLRKALADDWNDIDKFFTGQHGVLIPVETWFGKKVAAAWARFPTSELLAAAFWRTIIGKSAPSDVRGGL
jgi:hypothetical protein